MSSPIHLLVFDLVLVVSELLDAEDVLSWRMTSCYWRQTMSRPEVWRRVRLGSIFALRLVVRLAEGQLQRVEIRKRAHTTPAARELLACVSSAGAALKEVHCALSPCTWTAASGVLGCRALRLGAQGLTVWDAGAPDAAFATAVRSNETVTRFSFVECTVSVDLLQALTLAPKALCFRWCELPPAQAALLLSDALKHLVCLEIDGCNDIFAGEAVDTFCESLKASRLRFLLISNQLNWIQWMKVKRALIDHPTIEGVYLPSGLQNGPAAPPARWYADYDPLEIW